MDWFSVTSQLVVGLAWPVTVLVLILAFRREIRARLSAVREVKYPGGSVTMEVAELAARVEQADYPETAATNLHEELLPLGETDPQLSIARMRLSVEKELLRLSWSALEARGQIKNWSINRHIDELRHADALDEQLAENLKDFVEISNKILHGADIEERVKLRATVIGSTLAAQLHYRNLVRRMERDFQGHRLWHMHRRGNDSTSRYYWWSAVVASLPEFDYSYEIYQEAAERHNRSDFVADHPGDGVYVLSLEEFVRVLEFRERELLRMLDTWYKHEGKGDIWDVFRSANYWEWPAEWGELGWKAPIIRSDDRLHPYAVEEDLIQTRNALSRYRHKLLAIQRGSLPTVQSVAAEPHNSLQ